MTTTTAPAPILVSPRDATTRFRLEGLAMWLSVAVCLLRIMSDDDALEFSETVDAAVLAAGVWLLRRLRGEIQRGCGALVASRDLPNPTPFRRLDATPHTRHDVNMLPNVHFGDYAVIEVSTVQIRDNLSEIVNRVAYGGQRAAVKRRGKTIAVIICPEEAALLDRLIENEEDRIDLEAARKARAEKGAPISLDEVASKLNLPTPLRRSNAGRKPRKKSSAGNAGSSEQTRNQKKPGQKSSGRKLHTEKPPKKAAR